ADTLARDLFAGLVRRRRAGQIIVSGRPLGRRETIWVAAERLPEIVAIHGEAAATSLAIPESRSSRQWSREDAIVELLRGRLSMIGPTTARSLAISLAISDEDATFALITLETDGAVLRG